MGKGWFGTLDLDDDATQASINRLHDAVDANVTNRLPWLQAWRSTHPKWRPWVLGLLDDHGEVRAIAPLVRRRKAALIQVHCLGDASLDRCPIIGRTAMDSVELAKRVTGALKALRLPWNLYLRQLPSGSLFGASLARQMHVVEIRDGLERPIVTFDESLRSRAILSRNQRQAEAKARNRILRHGLVLEEAWINRSQAIADRFPEIRAVHRARDLQLRGASLLDDPEEGRFYDALLQGHLHQLELLELRLDGALAAYVLWIRMGAVRMVLDNRVAPKWTDFSAGLIANNIAMRTAAADPNVNVLDWGTGVQRYKLSSSNKLVPHEQLTAWSSRTLRYALEARRKVNSRVHGGFP